MKIMTFFLDDQEYAVDLSAVSEVGAGAGEVAASPLDLGAMLGAPRGDAPGRSAVLVVGGGGSKVALRVDRMGEVLEVGEGAVREVPRYFESPLLRGVVALGDRLMVLLAAERLPGTRAAAGASAPAQAEEGAA